MLGEREERRLHQEVLVNEAGKLIALEIAAELPDLWKRHPDGLTVRMLEKEFDLPYRSVHAAAVWLGANDGAKWARRPDRTSDMLVPLDWEAPAYDLTDRQQAVLDAVIGLAGRDGLTQASYASISKQSGTSPGSIVAHIEALQRKGYLEIVTPGGSNSVTVLRAHPDGSHGR
jgi:hypothetical protein